MIRLAGLVAVALFMLAGMRSALAQSAPAPIEIAGASFLEYDDATGDLRAEGAPVIVTRGRTEVRAARIRYDGRGRIITATGGVAVADPEFTLRAQSAELRLTDERIRASENVVVRTVRSGAPVTLTAPAVEGSLQSRRFAATGGVTVTRGDWTITGRRLDYDDRSQVAVATGDPVVRVKEATMTAPTITFLVAEERARGEGGVRLQRGELVGHAPRVEVYGREGRAVLLGGARVDRGADRITADVIEVDLDGTRVTARGTSRLVITPP